ncbi:hypothetical protein [Paraburkholderia sp. SIMBA_054]|uniref:DUF5983 family protein n=1 Tax=Paraburkholderia sp. SIMBA_054 TaxID=3085795 RepID=UPI0039798AB6
MIKNIWTMTIPVLSTAHLTLETRNELSNMSQFNADLTGVNICAEYAEGYFAYFNQGDDPGHMSDNVNTLRNWAKANGHEWVRFDSVGDAIDELPQYDW